MSAWRVAGVLRRSEHAADQHELETTSVAEWLARHRQAPALCRWLWHPLTFAALNQSPEEAAAAPFVRVLKELFGPRLEDSAIGLPPVPLDELFALLAATLVESRGGEIRTSTVARRSWANGQVAAHGRTHDRMRLS